ncbi:MAG: sulfatase-like hydrolase/transferase [Pseudomonadota bacterium]
MNILWLVADHQPYGNRPSSALDMPLQKKLAESGVRFSNARTVLPICSPARASMLTGVYPHQHGLTENDGRFGGREGLSVHDWIINKPFLEAGYRCAWFGKWHVDNLLCAADYGFEGFSLPGYGYPYSTTEYKRYLERHKLPAPSVTVESECESGIAPGTRIELLNENDWFCYESGTATFNSPVETHEAFFVADQAVEWIQSLSDEPFFLRVDTWGPHPPYTVGEPFVEWALGNPSNLSENYTHSLDYRPGHHREYRQYWQSKLAFSDTEWNEMSTRSMQHAALVEAALLGVVEAVERLGIADRTMVIFTADHGDAVGSNGGVANKGGLMVEETMRIPMLICGPRITNGAINANLVTSMDLPATILDACQLNAKEEFHGKSLMPSLSDTNHVVRDGLMTQHYGLHKHVIQRAYYFDTWKYVIQDDGFEELYNLADDPCEMKNLSAAQTSVEDLRRARTGLRNTMQETGDTDNPIFATL